MKPSSRQEVISCFSFRLIALLSSWRVSSGRRYRKEARSAEKQCGNCLGFRKPSSLSCTKPEWPYSLHTSSVTTIRGWKGKPSRQASSPSPHALSQVSVQALFEDLQHMLEHRTETLSKVSVPGLGYRLMPGLCSRRMPRVDYRRMPRLTDCYRQWRKAC